MIILLDGDLKSAIKAKKVLTPHEIKVIRDYYAIIAIANKHADEILKTARDQADKIIKDASEKAEVEALDFAASSMLSSAQNVSDALSYIEEKIFELLSNILEITLHGIKVSDIAYAAIKTYYNKFGSDLNSIKISVDSQHYDEVKDKVQQIKDGYQHINIELVKAQGIGGICQISSKFNTADITYEKLITLILGVINTKMQS